MSNPQTTKHTPEQTAELVRSKAEDLLRPLDIAINSVFPTAEFRRIMWIAVYEQVRTRIDAKA